MDTTTSEKFESRLMTNSNQMTLESRIVQTLKDDTLMKLVGDEDAITELVTRAIREALYQPVKEKRGYDWVEQPNMVVTAAKTVATKFAEKVANTLFDELMADPEKKKLVFATMVDMLPNAINNYMDNTVKRMMADSAMNSMYELQKTLKSDPQFLTR